MATKSRKQPLSGRIQQHPLRVAMSVRWLDDAPIHASQLLLDSEDAVLGARLDDGDRLAVDVRLRAAWSEDLEVDFFVGLVESSSPLAALVLDQWNQLCAICRAPEVLGDAPRS